MARRIGILGGTFDPIHNGHIQAARDAATALQLDLVLVIPAGKAWQKSGQVVAPAEDRYAMALLATIDHGNLDVSRIEVDRHDDSFTSNTLRELRALPEYTDSDFFFIVGADVLAGLPTWHDYPALLELATFVGVTRAGHPEPQNLPAELADLPLVSIANVDVSSTLIRGRIEAGESIDHMSPPNVVRYISKRNLYGLVAR